jgi:hypothetical protein
VTGVQDATSSFDCREPGCTAEVKTNKGLGGYCPRHRPKQAPRTGDITNGGGLAGKLDALKKLARDADRAEARARKLTQDALAAKKLSDGLRAEFGRLMRELSETA